MSPLSSSLSLHPMACLGLQAPGADRVTTVEEEATVRYEVPVPVSVSCYKRRGSREQHADVLGPKLSGKL